MSKDRRGPRAVLPARREVTEPFVALVDCEVPYDGRARSTLRRGHYVLMRKADGSFLVHGASLTVPVNCQPAGSRLDRTPEGYLCRGKRNETTRVILHRVVARRPASTAPIADADRRRGDPVRAGERFQNGRTGPE